MSCSRLVSGTRKSLSASTARHSSGRSHDLSGDRIDSGCGLQISGQQKDLGVFSDMFSDGLIDLYENGVINNKYCTTDPGVMTVSFVMGDPETVRLCRSESCSQFPDSGICQSSVYDFPPVPDVYCEFKRGRRPDGAGGLCQHRRISVQRRRRSAESHLGATMAPDRKGKGLSL